MNGIKRIRVGVAIVAAFAFVTLPGVSAAEDVDEAKQAGQVGERFDGYLGIVDDAAPVEIKALVEDVNQKRREKYKSVAIKNRIKLEQVQGVAGKKLIERTKDGQFVLPPKAEAWKKKN